MTRLGAVWKHQPWIVTCRRISELPKALIFIKMIYQHVRHFVSFEDNSCSFQERFFFLVYGCLSSPLKQQEAYNLNNHLIKDRT